MSALFGFQVDLVIWRLFLLRLRDQKESELKPIRLSSISFCVCVCVRACVRVNNVCVECVHTHSRLVCNDGCSLKQCLSHNAKNVADCVVVGNLYL